MDSFDHALDGNGWNQMYINFWSNDHLNGSIQLYILSNISVVLIKETTLVVWSLDAAAWLTHCVFCWVGSRWVGGWVGGSRSLFPGCQPILTSIFSQVYHLRYALNIVFTRLHYLVQFKDDHEGCAIRRSIFLAPGDSSSLQSRDNHPCNYSWIPAWDYINSTEWSTA